MTINQGLEKMKNEKRGEIKKIKRKEEEYKLIKKLAERESNKK